MNTHNMALAGSLIILVTCSVVLTRTVARLRRNIRACAAPPRTVRTLAQIEAIEAIHGIRISTLGMSHYDVVSEAARVADVAWTRKVQEEL